MKQILFFILFLTLLASFGNQGWVRLYRLTQFEKSLERENAGLAEDNNNLKREIRDLQDPLYVERYIRQELDLGEFTVQSLPRFVTEDEPAEEPQATTIAAAE